MKKIVGQILAAVLCMNLIAVPVSAEWKKTDDGMKYTDSSGEYVTGWQTINGHTYYFSKDGTMKTGWLKLKSGKKYYFDTKSGRMITGWKTIGENKYYFNKDGTMKTGWLETSSGTKYYLRSTGALAVNCTLTINGKKYTFDSSGKIKNTDLADFVAPTFGDSSSKVLKECGISDYTREERKGFISYTGKVRFAGQNSQFLLGFTMDDKLFFYGLIYNVPYLTYKQILDEAIYDFGDKYNIDDDGSYNWELGTWLITLNYVNKQCTYTITDTSLI
jgi:glucan-binding repeat-containing protein